MGARNRPGRTIDGSTKAYFLRRSPPPSRVRKTINPSQNQAEAFEKLTLGTVKRKEMDFFTNIASAYVVVGIGIITVHVIVGQAISDMREVPSFKRSPECERRFEDITRRMGTLEARLDVIEKNCAKVEGANGAEGAEQEAKPCSPSEECDDLVERPDAGY